MNFAWPLVGREEELALIASTIAASEIGAIVVSGEAGVGKSRVVGEALSAADRGGLAIERVTATDSAASIPFGAFSFRRQGLVRPGEGRMGAIREATADLLERADGRRLVLGVDDADRLDEGSAALVLHLARTGAAFVIACLRSDNAVPDAVSRLWRDGLAERLELPALSREQTNALLEAALGAPTGGETSQRVWEATAGNPLYVRELVLGAIEARSLAKRDGVWCWSGSVAEAPRLTELLEERLGSLAAEQREALELVAIAEPVPVEVLTELTGTAVLEEIERLGLLQVRSEAATSQVRLSHPLYGEVLRARAPGIAARGMKRRLADAFEQRGSVALEDSLRIATWRVESGTAGDAESLIEASHTAAVAFAFGLAADLARAAVDADGGWRAEQALAKAMVRLGSFEEAEKQFQAAASHCTGEADVVRIAVPRANNLWWHLGRDQDAAAVIDEAVAVAESPELRSAIDAARSSFLVYGGETEQAIALSARVLEDADAWTASTWAAAMINGLGLACAGRLDESLELVDGLLERTAAPDTDQLDAPPLARFWLLTSRFTSHCFLGRFDQGLAEGRAVYDDAVEIGAPSGRAMSAFSLGWTARLQGSAESAARWLRESVSHLREVDTFPHLSSTLGELAQAEALLGHVDAAEAALAGAEAARMDCLRMDEIGVGLGRAWVAAARGETSAAIAHALETARVTGTIGQHFFRALALHDALRLGEVGVVKELEALTEIVDGELTAAFARHARATRSGDPEALAEVAAAFESCGALLYAAEAGAEAANAFREAGRADSARTEAGRARAFLLSCEGATTPLLAGLELPELSRRELEVASLAARGLSNAEIAEQLVVSVRTVENHLHNGYAKLGVSARDELAPALGID
jgi:ATP/maltotriose-dependent transcriptional regulator MalT